MTPGTGRRRSPGRRDGRKFGIRLRNKSGILHGRR